MKPGELERRQWELWSIALVTILVFAGTIIYFGLFTENRALSLALLGAISILLCVYIVVREKKLMVLSHRLRQEELLVLEEQAKVSLVNTRLKELSALHKAGEAICLERAPQKSLDIILQCAMDLFEATRGWLMLLDPKSENFLVASGKGIDPKWIQRPQKCSEGVAGWVLRTGEPVLLAGNVRDERFVNFVETESDVRSAMSAPLRLHEKVIGVINCTVTGENKKQFTSYDLKMLSVFAQYAAIAIENAQLRMAFKQGKPLASFP